MLITDLDHLETCGEVSDILGGISTENILSLNYRNGILSLSLGEQELFQTALETAPTGLRFSFEDTHTGFISFTSTALVDQITEIGPIRTITSSSGTRTSFFSLIPHPYFL